MKKVSKHQLERNIEDMHDVVKNKMMEWNNAIRNGQTKKDFLSYFPAAERQFHTGFPILKKDSFDFKTPPTFHFKLHWFDYLKKVNIQMGSRKYTKSKKSVAEIEQSIELEQSKMKKKPKKQRKIKKTSSSLPKSKMWKRI